MKKTFTSFLCAIFIFTLGQIAYAQPLMSSNSNSSFEKNDSSKFLEEITITDDTQTPFIKAENDLRITIPHDVYMLFDDTRSINEIFAYGTAVENGKISSKPEITFTDRDKSVIIPVLENFEAGESFTIRNLAVKGFNDITSESQYLHLYFDPEQDPVRDEKYFYITSSSKTDTNPPKAPFNISITQESETSVKLIWEDPTDLDVKIINIYRGLNATPVDAGTAHKQLGPGVQEFIDTGLKIGSTVKYMLRAEDGPNLGAISDEYAYTLVEMAELEEEEEISEEEEETEEVLEDETIEEEAQAEEETVFCTMEYNPVCGVDGKTYSNECVAREQNKVEIAYFGECREVEFTDIGDHWAKSQIEKLAQLKIVKGDPSGTFRPDDNLNRAESSALIYRLLGLEEPVSPLYKTFLDVETGEWYSGYIASLKEMELLKGNPDGTFRPADMTNRAEFLVMTMRIYYQLADETKKAEMDNAPAYDPNYHFADITEDNWYSDTLNIAASYGFIEGFECAGGKCFYPEQRITRAESSVILYNMFFD